MVYECLCIYLHVCVYARVYTRTWMLLYCLEGRTDIKQKEICGVGATGLTLSPVRLGKVTPRENTCTCAATFLNNLSYLIEMEYAGMYI